MVSTSSGSDLCFICIGAVEACELSVLKARGVARLLESSLKRKLSTDEQFLGGLSEVRVHSACQTRYNNEKLIAAFARRGYDTSKTPSPVFTRRSQVGKFNFTDACFLCVEAITEDFRAKQAKLPVERRNAPFKVTTRNSQYNYRKGEDAWRHRDNWGRKIEECISQLSNLNTHLVAVNAE